MKRFWNAVTVEETGDGYAIRLDDRPVRTPAKAPCVLPTRALAQAMAEEWEAQGDAVDPAAMPVTRAANSAIDRVIPEAGAVAAAIAAFGESDLICYRANHPDGLVYRQVESWDPLVAWAETALGARLTLSEGVMFVAQPPGSLARLTDAVGAHSVWELTALHDLVTLSGSLVIGLAVSRGHLTADRAWPLSRIDEDWNIEEWGEDAEAVHVAERRRTDFMNAARLLTLIRS
ncbi:MAG: ATPase [Paracoccaceae bacterium]|nr:ATPase [Paracoccaceae bacterium]